MSTFNKFCREVSFKLLDKGLLETFGPHAILINFVSWSAKIASITSGYLFHYSFIIIFGLSLILFVNFFAVDYINFEFLFLQFCLVCVFVLKFKVSSHN